MFYIKMNGLYFRDFLGGETPSRCANWTRNKQFAKAFESRSGIFGADAVAAAITPTGHPITVEEE